MERRTTVTIVIGVVLCMGLLFFLFNIGYLVNMLLEIPIFSSPATSNPVYLLARWLPLRMVGDDLLEGAGIGWDARLEAVYMRKGKAVDFLVNRTVGNQKAIIRRNAIRVLAAIVRSDGHVGAGIPVAPLMMRGLSDRESYVRERVLEVLGMILPPHDKRIVKICEKVMHEDMSGEVRAEALYVLLHNQEEILVCMPFIERGLSDPSMIVRDIACDQIIQYGRAAGEVYASLLEKLQDERYYDTWMHMSEALAAIDRKRALHDLRVLYLQGGERRHIIREMIEGISGEDEFRGAE